MMQHGNSGDMLISVSQTFDTNYKQAHQEPQ